MFNLYFAGFRSKQEDENLRSKNVLRLLSYVNDRKHVEKYIAEGYPIFLDSGAFSAHTRGIDLNVDQYIEFINYHDKYITIAAQVDTIPGKFGQPKTKEDLEGAPELSWKNYLYMRERMTSPNKLLPIYHQGEDFKHLHRMLEFEPRIEYMGISPANDLSTKEKEVWIKECFKIIKRSPNPNVKTHAFGMTSLRLLEKFPFFTADSTTWIQSAINGSIITEYGTLLISEKQKNNPTHIDNLPISVRDRLIHHIEKNGFNFSDMMKDTKERTRWNVHYLVEWSQNYKYRPQTVSQGKLF